MVDGSNFVWPLRIIQKARITQRPFSEKGKSSTPSYVTNVIFGQTSQIKARVNPHDISIIMQ